MGNLRKETVAWRKGGGPRPQVVALRLGGGAQQPGLTRLRLHSRELRNNGSKLPRLPPFSQASLDSAITSCSHSNTWGLWLSWTVNSSHDDLCRDRQLAGRGAPADEHTRGCTREHNEHVNITYFSRGLAIRQLFGMKFPKLI